MATVPDRLHQTPLTDDELEHLHDDDLHAAQIVVGLITGVFTTGLVMYAAICWIAM
ncbi:MAG: hypothetical protein HYR84_16860 [Planctomycetes bacterium]|nr:hypothetical protein [Planctomycetota bacterium]